VVPTDGEFGGSEGRWDVGFQPTGGGDLGDSEGNNWDQRAGAYHANIQPTWTI